MNSHLKTFLLSVSSSYVESHILFPTRSPDQVKEFGKLKKIAAVWEIMSLSKTKVA